MTATLAFVVSYHGSAGHGWQRQQRGDAIQSLLERAFATVDGDVPTVRGASRTDAGVHARMQFATAQLRRDDLRPRQWLKAVNGQLPMTVQLRWAAWAPAHLTPRGWAGEKTYVYRFLFAPTHDPLVADRTWWLPGRAEPARMTAVAPVWLGQHDFAAAHHRARSQAEHTIRTLTRSEVRLYPGGYAVYIVSGPGFLTHQVRILAGTLAAVAQGRLQPHDVRHAMASGDRQRLGPTAPAHGLTLERIVIPPAAWRDAWPMPDPNALPVAPEAAGITL